MRHKYHMMFLAGIILLPSLFSQQLSKFEKWQQPSYFKGFCISDWNNLTDTYVAQQEFTDLKITGANLVIIQSGGINAVTAPYATNIWDADGSDIIYWQDVLDDMVTYARNAGLQYMIAVRSGPGRIDVAEDEGGSTIWTNQQEQRLYGQMLKNIAKRYLPDDLFVGLDLTVEPNPHGELAGEPVASLAAALAADGTDMNAIYSIWIDSVRTVAPNLPLMVQGIHWSNPAYFSLVKKQADDKIVYKTHCYNPFDYSHAENAFAESYPATFWSDATQNMEFFNKTFFETIVFSEIRKIQTKYDVPVLIGEFGISYPQNGGENYLSDLMSIAEENGWHFSLWNWNNTPDFNYAYLDQTYGTDYMDSILVHINKKTTGVKLSRTIGEDCTLYQNYPNPFNPETTIRFHLSAAAKAPVRAQIYVLDMRGRMVCTLLDERKAVGTHTVFWDGKNDKGQILPSGLYFYQLKAGIYMHIKKMLLLR